MHVINYSRNSEGSGAGFWVYMVSRVSLQDLGGGGIRIFRGSKYHVTGHLHLGLCSRLSLSLLALYICISGGSGDDTRYVSCPLSLGYGGDCIPDSPLGNSAYEVAVFAMR